MAMFDNLNIQDASLDIDLAEPRGVTVSTDNLDIPPIILYCSDKDLSARVENALYASLEIKNSSPTNIVTNRLSIESNPVVIITGSTPFMATDLKKILEEYNQTMYILGDPAIKTPPYYTNFGKSRRKSKISKY